MSYQNLTKARQILKNFRISGATARGKTRLVTTVTNRKMKKIESEAESFLLKKANFFISLNEPMPDIISVYSSEILEFLISITTKSYKLGFDFIEAKLGTETELDLDDMARIRVLAKKGLDRFWNTVRRGKLEKEKETLKIKGASAFDFINLITRMITTEAVNTGTISATLYYKDTQPLGSAEIIYEFVTMRDDRVDCSICAPLDGILMRESDFHFAQPPLHFGCRCRLIPRLDGETLSG